MTFFRLLIEVDIMGILTSVKTAKIDRVIALMIAILMGMGGLLVIDFSEVSANPEIEDIQQSAGSPLNDQLKSGDTYLSDIAPEYMIEGQDSSGYFGNVMKKLDFNGDGYVDLAVGQPRNYQVCIYDGKTQLEFPNLYETSKSARWKISGSSYFGSDIDVGDINGDGYDDLVVARASYSGYTYLYYGGPQWDNLGSVSYSYYDAYIYNYYYAAKTVGVGDIDGDGYDDILTTSSGSSSSYSGVYIWYGSPSFSGYHYYSSADARIRTTSYMASGGVETGDMNGDGKDEIIFASPYSRDRTVMMISKGTGRPRGYLYVGSYYSYCEWAIYYEGNYFSFNVGFEDIDEDGYDDLIMSSPRGKKLYIIDGEDNLDTGYIYLDREDDKYDRVISASSPSEFGSFAFGDYNKDGKKDMAAGGQGGEVFILDNSIINKTEGKIDGEKKANWTIHEPSGSRYFAYTGYYYYYYSYPHYITLCFWDRNGDGYDDIFISDPQKSVSGVGSYTGAIYGISPVEMAGLDEFVLPEGDLPDGETFYGAYKNYTCTISFWNRWSPDADAVGVFLNMGPYDMEIRWNQEDGLQEINDPNNMIEVDTEGYQLIVTHDDVYRVKIRFNVTFTINLDVECDLYMLSYMSIAHLNFKDEKFQYAGKIRNKFRFVGDLEVYNYDPVEGRGDMIPAGKWLPENRSLEITGMKLVYNGTEDFPEDFGTQPYCPHNDMFHIEMKSNRGETKIDDSSSGKDFDFIMEAGSDPRMVIYQGVAKGISTSKLMNGIPDFYVNVDTDVPTPPSGIQIHADSFDDEQVLVDNDGELYVTWSDSMEYNSGIDHYELRINGDDSTRISLNEKYAKINTSSVGEIEVQVRATDKVGHIGQWGSADIYIDSETLSFTGFTTGSAEATWHNTLTPQVMITISDIEGRAVIGDSVEYQISYDGGQTYSNWMDAEQVLIAKDLLVKMNPELKEGDQNLIRFKAMDEAGNYEESEAYSISADVSGVNFGKPMVDGTPLSSIDWLDSGEVQISLEIADKYSGVDPNSIEYRMSTRGRTDLETEVWKEYDGTFTGGMLTMDLSLKMGDENFIQFRAMDMIGNPYSYTPPFNLWVNTMPTVSVKSPTDGAEEIHGKVFLFDATDSSDYDGDELSATWTDTHTPPEGSPLEIILGEDSDDVLRFEEVLEPGAHSIVLTLTDGLHEVTSEPINVTVIPRVDPIWMDPEMDSDDDGMDNLWEYTYHLPWNSSDNGQESLTDTNDFDGDGFSDLVEYQEGTNPTDVIDFPVEKYSGEEEEDTNILGIFDTIWIFLAVLIPIIILLVAILALLGFSLQAKSSIKNAESKEAEEQEALVQKALESGGRD